MLTLCFEIRCHTHVGILGLLVNCLPEPVRENLEPVRYGGAMRYGIRDRYIKPVLTMSVDTARNSPTRTGILTNIEYALRGSRLVPPFHTRPSAPIPIARI